ncbi:MAG: hypothetical protein U1F16_04475 [Turneriella sp.]
MLFHFSSHAAFSPALTYPLSRSTDGAAPYVMSALLGFFFLPGYALLLSATEEFAGKEKQVRLPVF